MAKDESGKIVEDANSIASEAFIASSSHQDIENVCMNIIVLCNISAVCCLRS